MRFIESFSTFVMIRLPCIPAALRPGPGPALRRGLRRGLQQEVPIPAQPEEAPGAVAGAARQVRTNAIFCE